MPPTLSTSKCDRGSEKKKGEGVRRCDGVDDLPRCVVVILFAVQFAARSLASHSPPPSTPFFSLTRVQSFDGFANVSVLHEGSPLFFSQVPSDHNIR